MDNKPQIFTFEDSKVRALAIDGEPYFVGKDVAEVLGYSDSNQAIRKHVDSEDKLTRQFNGSGQNRNMIVINESGLYSLILSSKLPNAKKFKRWVTSEVLPSIRKHGTYMTDSKIEEVLTNPDTIIKIATQLKEEREARMIAEQTISKQQPKVEYYDSQMKNPGLMNITEISKDFGMSGSALNKRLEELGIQYRRGKRYYLYQKYAGKGYAQYEPYTYDDHGRQGLNNRLKWTMKGRKFIFDQLAKVGIHPTIEVMNQSN